MSLSMICALPIVPKPSLASYLERLAMQTTPDTPRCLRRTLHRTPFEGLDLRARGVEQNLHLLLNAGDLEAVQRDDLVSVID